MRNWTAGLIDKLDTDEIIGELVTEVIENLDINAFVKELQEQLVNRLAERIMIELNEAINRSSG